ncbi:hypothetical protein GOM49_06665 [Clostridium bovifaecis]|uniref:Uncharacterized protein n=1 Tax=Clostridium bovifaecis TaxID=2184719 RepID=A0A6I6EWT5_9CLOT|nr:hypothetical protein GOM49_06665 [Clostridium bovifaecis]
MVLITLINSILAALIKQKAIDPSKVTNVFIFLGTPIIAVGLGVIGAIYGLAGKMNRQDVINEMEKGIKSAGIMCSYLF